MKLRGLNISLAYIPTSMGLVQRGAREVVNEVLAQTLLLKAENPAEVKAGEAGDDYEALRSRSLPTSIAESVNNANKQSTIRINKQITKNENDLCSCCNERFKED